MKFWNWETSNGSENKNENGERTLRINGVIAPESWWGDEVTPEIFRNELNSGTGNVTVWLNSPGGDCIAASQIYSMLAEYGKGAGNITVKIDGLAASAASVIAMAADKVLMSPTSLMMAHNPSTFAWGDSGDMMRAKAVLDEVKESIINAYQLKTKQSREMLSDLMDSETWMSANKAIELGFADGMLKSQTADSIAANADAYTFSQRHITNCLVDKVAAAAMQAQASARLQTPVQPQTPVQTQMPTQPQVCPAPQNSALPQQCNCKARQNPTQPQQSPQDGQGAQSGASIKSLDERLRLIGGWNVKIT